MDKYDGLPKLDIEDISEEEFSKLLSLENSFISTPITKKKGNYYLETNNNCLQLKAKNEKNIVNKDGETWYDYLGFYPSLNMYAVSFSSVSEGIGFSDFELINKSNGKRCKIISIGDDKIETPLPSPKSNYIAYFYNQIYSENQSFLGILQIDSNKNLNEFKSLNCENFKICQIAWSGNNIILIKTSSDEGKNFKYYKCDILSTRSSSTDISNSKDRWEGQYYFEESNRDGIKTVYDILINSLDNITINFDDHDGGKKKYLHVKAEVINNEKIKITYDPSLEDEMGIIYIEKSNNGFLISGNPIYFINPGNNEMTLQKIH